MSRTTFYGDNNKLEDLFDTYNSKYFRNQIKNCEVKWSNRLTSCAGKCIYYGNGQPTQINISLPILSQRTKKDLTDILLHEMIHAYVYSSYNETEEHGPQFYKWMDKINEKGRHRITVLHSFEEEVDQLQTHVWKCTGKCTDLAPKYGVVKRSINRSPGPSEQWFRVHKKECSGKFVKVKEPQN